MFCMTHRIVGVLDEGIDGHQGEVGLGLGIVDQIQVHKLLQFQVI